MSPRVFEFSLFSSFAGQVRIAAICSHHGIMPGATDISCVVGGAIGGLRLGDGFSPVRAGSRFNEALTGAGVGYSRVGTRVWKSAASWRSVSITSCEGRPG